MSLRHAPHSRPVAASLQHPSLSLTPLSIFSTSPSFSNSGVFVLFIISCMCCVLLTIYLLSESDFASSSLSFSLPTSSLSLSLFNSLDLTHSIFPLCLLFSLSATLTHSPFLSLIFSEAGKSRDGTRLTLNCLMKDQSQPWICILTRQFATLLK